MEFRTLNAILDDLGKAIAWFESIGLSTKETRLQAIHHYLFEQIHFPDPDATLPEYDH
jgi:fido (protein-threonine AMPylation protein)